MQIKGTACPALLSTPLFCFQEVMFHLDFLFAFTIENSILSSRLSNLDHRFSKHRGSRIEFRVETVNICCFSFRNGLPASISDEVECQQRRTLRMIIIKWLCRKPKYTHFAEEDLVSPPSRNYPYLQPPYTPSPREINTDH